MEFAKDKHIIIPIGLAIAAIIAYRSWHDMHPPPPGTQAGLGSHFLVRDDQTLATVTGDKEDQHAFTILAGDIKLGPDKKVTLTPSKVTPINIAQREIILLYTLDGKLPAPDELEADDLAAALHASGEKWREQGDVINDIYLDDVSKKPDAAALLALCNPLREKLHKDYWLGIYIDRKTLESLPDPSKQISEIGKSTRMLIFDAKKSLKAGETMGAMILDLDKLNMAFMLSSDEMPDYNAVRQEIADKSKEGTKNFMAFMIDPEKLRKAAQ